MNFNWSYFPGMEELLNRPAIPEKFADEFRGMEDIVNPGCIYMPGDRHQIEFLRTLKRWIKKTAFYGCYTNVDPSAAYQSAVLTQEALAVICRQMKDACFQVFDLIITLPTVPAPSEDNYEYDRIPDAAMFEAIQRIYGVDMTVYEDYFYVMSDERSRSHEEFENVPISQFAYLWCTLRTKEANNMIEYTLFMNARTLSILNTFIGLQLRALFSGETSLVFKVKFDVVCLLNVCSNCMKTGVKLNACSRCSRAMYCSRECQKAHWKAEHKTICEDKSKPDVLLCGRL
jgi:hypothetical protein